MFDVWFFYPGGYNTRERENVSVEEAMKFAAEATTRPAVRMGTLVEIRIVDKDDMCVFQWIAKKGVVFPEVEK
jgi:hypothetical protein